MEEDRQYCFQMGSQVGWARRSGHDFVESGRVGTSDFFSF